MIARRILTAIAAAIGVLAASPAYTQQPVNLNRVIGTLQPGNGGTGTIPATTPPATCTVGQTFFDTNATAGQNWYGCTATNTWTLQGDGGGGGGGTGDVVGPASAIDNSLVRFDGTTGKLLQGYTSNTPTCTDAGVCTFTAPIFVTPALGTPASGVATNLTGTASGLTAGTASAVAVGGITGLGTGVGTFLATPSSANFASMITDESGTAGTVVLSVSPTFTGTITAAAANFSGNVSAANMAPLSGALTNGGLIRTDGTNVLSTAALTGILQGNGTSAPTAITPGTGVATALAAAVNGAGGAVLTDGTATLTNKTLDAEGTGNVITIPTKVWLPAAGCNNATASSFWDLPTSTPAVAACVTGTNTQKGVLQFADTSGGFSAQNAILLPTDFSGAIDARIIWRTSATSGNAKFSLSTICTAVDATETDDPAFNTASTVTTAAAGTTLRLQTSAITGVTATGCAAGEFLHIRLFRDGNDGSDTLSASLDVIGVELTIRRAM